MNIYLDNIIFSNVTNGGVSHYWFEFIKYIQKLNTDTVSFFEDSKALRNFHREKLIINEEQLIRLKQSFLSRVSPVSYTIKEEKALFHSSYYRTLNSTKEVIGVTTVYDFILNFHAPWHKRILHNRLKYNAIKQSKGVICISKNTYSDLKKFCPVTKNQRAEVIYIGVSDAYHPIKQLSEKERRFLNKYDIGNRRFLLFVGNRTNYKHFDYVVSQLKRDKKMRLVTVGGGDFTTNEIKLLRGVAERVLPLQSITNQELNVLYNCAFALVYPSEYEGFGIPVVEAMRSGCPVIGYNQPLITEIGGDAVIALDKLDAADFDRAVDQLQHADFKSELIEKGFEQSAQYSWEKCSRETHAFYKHLYDLY